jgi:hypothetical protein
LWQERQASTALAVLSCAFSDLKAWTLWQLVQESPRVSWTPPCQKNCAPPEWHFWQIADCARALSRSMRGCRVNRVPRDEACFTCHTNYTLFGDYKAKLRGLRHVYVNYIGTIPKQIKLYEPYNKRECLHCHGGARAFEENEVHQPVRDDLAKNTTSCLECHDKIHDVHGLAGVKLWKETVP